MKDYNPKLELIKLDGLSKADGHVRQETGDIKKLEKNINKNGVMNPPVLAKKEDGSLVTVDGDRRIKSLLNLDVEHTFCLVHEGLTDAEIAHLSYFHNTLRENITPIDQASHLKMMIDKYGLSYIQLEALGYGSRSQISKFLGLLKHSSGIQEKISEGKLTVAHGTALLKAQNPEKMADIIIEKNLSAAKAVKFIKDLNEKQNGPEKVSPWLSSLMGFDTSTIEDNSIDCIVSILDKDAWSNSNLKYLKFQFSEAARTLNRGGIMAVCLQANSGREIIYQMINNRNSPFYMRTEFVIEIIDSDFKAKVGKQISDTVHGQYRAESYFLPLLICRKSYGITSSEVATAPKLSEEEAEEYLRSCWCIQSTGSTNEIISRIIKMYSIKGDTILDLFSGRDNVNEAARSLGRICAEDKLAQETTDSTESGSTSNEELAEKMTDYAKRVQEESEQGQPKVAVIASKGMVSALRNRDEERNKELEDA